MCLHRGHALVLGIFLAVEVYFDLCRLENSHVTAAATLLALAALPSMLANAAAATLLALAALPSMLANAATAALLARAAMPSVLADAGAAALLAAAASPPVLADAAATALLADAASSAMRTGVGRPTASALALAPALSAAVVQIPPVPLLVIGTESLVSVNVPRTCSSSSTADSPWMAFGAFGSLLESHTDSQ